MLQCRWLRLAGAILLNLVLWAPVLADVNVRLGMGPPGGSAPPEVIDMSWARPYLDANATGASNATSEE
ncbi:hypothetical protein [Pseudodesulfovibrio sp.]|uniref:hypothetical protein n=1 Tax=Pseudodesulfovibrio sp. TaxID=2035812 RepID=UPI0026392053|nr:hypothetical protein [Pseudodesulfovibrio sp.]MDD3312895.1 hypothetical protein [Pseudodesulfovibrio sp.]